MNQIAVGIIGTGRIGTDLLMKVTKSDLLTCKLFVGRNENSHGLQVARSMGIATSHHSIQGVVQAAESLEIIFDATSAHDHRIHAPIFEELGLLAIDLTPAKLASSCIPSINIDAARLCQKYQSCYLWGTSICPNH